MTGSRRPTPLRPSIRHRRVPRQQNRFVAPVMLLAVLALVMQMYWMQNNWGEMVRREDRQPMSTELMDLMRAKVITMYECDYCSGSGVLDDPDVPGERMLCGICQGVGYQLTRRFTPQDRMCLNCGGMGRIFSDDRQQEADFCPRCDGRGLIEFGD